MGFSTERRSTPKTWLTRLVNKVPDHEAMINPAPPTKAAPPTHPTRPTADSSPRSPTTDAADPLASCQAMLVGLGRGRFAIVRPDEPQRDLWPIEGGWDRIRQIQAGDRVIYRGQTSRVRSVEVYC